MIHKVIGTGAGINLFYVAVMEHFRESLGEVHFDVVCGVDPQGQQNRRSVLCLLALCVRHEVPPPLVQGSHTHDVAGRHLRESCGGIHLQTDQCYIKTVMLPKSFSICGL